LSGGEGLKVYEERELKRRTQQARQAAAWSCELLVSRLRHAKAGPPRRRQRGAPPCAERSWGRDGAAVPRREVEGVVVEDDAVLALGIRGRDHECFRAGSLARP